MTTKTIKKQSAVDFGLLTKGSQLSMVYYLTVNSVNVRDGVMQVTDQHGNNFTVKGKNLIETTMYSANQYTETRKISRTEMVEKLESAGDTIFTVNFVKQDGTNRQLVGHLLSTEPKMGRSQVVDLQLSATETNKTRLVDHRTLNELIIRGVRYLVKK